MGVGQEGKLITAFFVDMPAQLAEFSSFDTVLWIPVVVVVLGASMTVIRSAPIN